MLLDRKYDKLYKPWFAWYPVFLYGPDEWDRMNRVGAGHRLVWLRRVWRARLGHTTYYAIPDEHTNNNMLLASIEEYEKNA